MDIYDGFKLIAGRSPMAMREAIKSLRVPNTPMLMQRYLWVLFIALGDPGAEFTESERRALAEIAEPPESQTRDYTLRVRLTESEQATLQQMADDSGISLSEYVRSRLF